MGPWDRRTHWTIAPNGLPVRPGKLSQMTVYGWSIMDEGCVGPGLEPQWGRPYVSPGWSDVRDSEHRATLGSKSRLAENAENAENPERVVLNKGRERFEYENPSDVAFVGFTRMTSATHETRPEVTSVYGDHPDRATPLGFGIQRLLPQGCAALAVAHVAAPWAVIGPPRWGWTSTRSLVTARSVKSKGLPLQPQEPFGDRTVGASTRSL